MQKIPHANRSLSVHRDVDSKDHVILERKNGTVFLMIYAVVSGVPSGVCSHITSRLLMYCAFIGFVTCFKCCVEFD